jgi:hypothetical protein
MNFGTLGGHKRRTRLINGAGSKSKAKEAGTVIKINNYIENRIKELHPRKDTTDSKLIKKLGQYQNQSPTKANKINKVAAPVNTLSLQGGNIKKMFNNHLQNTNIK